VSRGRLGHGEGFDTTGDDLGVALVPLPVEIGDELALPDHPWPLEIVTVVPASVGAKVAALVEVRPAVLHTV
jgi:hypothetical protein